MSSRRREGPDALLILGIAVFALFGLPSVALAWGPSVHLWIGDTLIQAVGAALPLMAALLRRHARSYLYGCLSPDFYVGKGSSFHDAHCHNWSVGKKLLAAARTEPEEAFALGYMTHLAADVIGHNYFVPNNLYRSFGVQKVGHVYFELHADNLLDPAYVDLAHVLVRARGGDTEGLDALLDLVVDHGFIPFEAKKRVFTSWIAVSNGDRLKRLLSRVRPYSEWLLSNDCVRDQMELSLALAYEMLKDPDVPAIGRYDPIGATNLRLARELRRESKRAHVFSRKDIPFPIPAELRAFRRSLAELTLDGEVRATELRPASELASVA